MVLCGGCSSWTVRIAVVLSATHICSFLQVLHFLLNTVFLFLLLLLFDRLFCCCFPSFRLVSNSMHYHWLSPFILPIPGSKAEKRYLARVSFPPIWCSCTLVFFLRVVFRLCSFTSLPCSHRVMSSEFEYCPISSLLHCITLPLWMQRMACLICSFGLPPVRLSVCLHSLCPAVLHICGYNDLSRLYTVYEHDSMLLIVIRTGILVLSYGVFAIIRSLFLDQSDYYITTTLEIAQLVWCPVCVVGVCSCLFSSVWCAWVTISGSSVLCNRCLGLCLVTGWGLAYSMALLWGAM